MKFLSALISNSLQPARRADAGATRPMVAPENPPDFDQSAEAVSTQDTGGILQSSGPDIPLAPQVMEPEKTANKILESDQSLGAEDHPVVPPARQPIGQDFPLSEQKPPLQAQSEKIEKTTSRPAPDNAPPASRVVKAHDQRLDETNQTSLAGNIKGLSEELATTGKGVDLETDARIAPEYPKRANEPAGENEHQGFTQADIREDSDLSAQSANPQAKAADETGSIQAPPLPIDPAKEGANSRAQVIVRQHSQQPLTHPVRPQNEKVQQGSYVEPRQAIVGANRPPKEPETPQVRIGQINVLIDDQATAKAKSKAAPARPPAGNPFGLRGL